MPIKKQPNNIYLLQKRNKIKLKIDWSNYVPPVPAFTGTKIFKDYDLAEIRKYIDWQPFFIAWEMHGKFPQILTDDVIGTEATKLYNDANALLDKLIAEKWLTAQGVIGFWEANAIAADTIEVKSREVRSEIGIITSAN